MKSVHTSSLKLYWQYQIEVKKLHRFIFASQCTSNSAASLFSTPHRHKDSK